MELNFRKKYSINIVALRQGDELCLNIDPEKPLEEGMRLVLIANVEKLNKILK